ncbi:translation initiation factor IF-3 [Mycoplasma iguanae]|uniref:Translation initiation factor IF-3 n=1 Tax=Mycoplasma iguanae TaxID=292461 RepID=A0ABY5R923_9MOLU|nr:translation initiation factor IF-3 [Mycoplasma iguanae]UVD82011.1 translation initiation factor IF-3 [Mycoplasma iguanae]
MVNNNIPFPKVFVFDQNNEKIGVKTLKEAVALAQEAKMDLVLISVDNSSGKPKPITRILDYGKFKYDRKKKKKEAKEKQTFIQNREIRLTPRINDNDIKTKAKKAREFLLNGDRIKVSLKFRGRELLRPELGIEVLDKLFAYVEDIAKKTKEPQINDRFLDMNLEIDKKKKPIIKNEAQEEK